MPRSPRAPTAAEAGLVRLCALVERRGSEWVVGPVVARSLAEALYAGWYTQPASPPPAAEDDPPLRHGSLLPALRAAHAQAATAVSGWAVTRSSPGGTVVAANGASSRVLRPGDYHMPLRPGVPSAPGEPVAPVARLDRLDDERGLWWAFSDPEPRPPVGRLYLNARAATGPRAIHELTAALRGHAHQLKCPVFPAAWERVDAIVVYHERDAREAMLAALDERWAALGPLLDPAVPPLTREVAPGLAWADDVDPERSFGESHCRAIAAAIEAAGTGWSQTGPQDRLAVVIAGLKAAGVDPEAPWLAST
jgi:hypothetical protein